MRVAHLARVCYPFHPFGGLEKHVSEIVMEQARLGYEVDLFTQPADPGKENPGYWPANVWHHFKPYRVVKFLRRHSIPDRLVNYPLFALRLGRAVRQLPQKPDIVHAHGLVGLGYALRPLPGVPYLVNPQGMEEFKSPSRAKRLAYFPFRVMLRFVAKRSAAVIATDRVLIPEVEKYLKVPPSKVVLIPNVVDLAAVDRYLVEGPPPDLLKENHPAFLILSVGRLEENKGFGVGLEALKILDRTGKLPPGWRWLVVGEGTLRAKLEAQAAALGLSEKVIFTGKLPDSELYRLYRCADLFLHPTLYEGSSLVTLEAMAAGLPVVASASGGLPDKVFESGPFENGRLAPPGDSQALAGKIAEVLALPVEQRRTLGRNGRRLVEDRFSWQAALAAYTELYQKLTGNRA